MSQMNIYDEDLHAYVDGELSDERRTEVEAYLSNNPAAFERVQAYQEQKQAIKILFSSVLNEPAPERLLTAAMLGSSTEKSTQKTQWYPSWSLKRIAASFLLAMGSGAVGWVAHSELSPAYPDVSVAQVDRVIPSTGASVLAPGLAHQAAIAHVVYSPDIKRPVEVGADQEDQLVAWLSKRLNADVRPPSLSSLGFELIGGRLLPGSNGPVAQFMYHDVTGQRLTLYVSTENKMNKDTAFRFSQEGPVNVFYWIDGKFGYAISAGIDKAELARVATSVFKQIANKD